MNTETIKSCPRCNAPIPAEAPQGLCPQCLLAAASTGTEPGQPPEAAGLPSLETIAAGFPQLEILQFIGQGGMGLVFKARQPKLDRFVALKLLPQKPGANPAFCERFHREARVLARLSHPNIVAVHDFGEAGPFFYLVMEYVDGVNLRQAMKAGRFTSAQALALVPKICDALQYAHEEGVLHRDIKPENLLLDKRGRMKIADFGIAKLVGDAKDITLTASGSAVGTPHYMAPEQLERPQDVDQRADVYSLGVVFYEMLTGELPIGRFAPPSEKAPMDPRVDQVVLRTLEKERERRFQTAGAVKTEVEHITASSPASHHGPTGTINLAATSPRSSPPTGSSATAPAPDKPSRWSVRTVGSALLVSVSLMAFAIAIANPNRIGPGEVPWMVFLIGLPALTGTFVAWRTLRDLRNGGVHLRGSRLALISAIAWPLMLLDLIMISIPLLFAESFQWNVLHVRGGPLTPFVGVVTAFAILAVDVLVLRHLLKRWRLLRESPHTEIRAVLTRLPRRALWLSASGFAVLTLALLISHRRIRLMDEPSTAAMVQEPNAAAGFELAPGGPPGDERRYRSSVIVPSGYALTLTAVLCSNQVVLKPSPGSASATLMAPQGQPIQGILSWKLLGGTTLADGAPLQFSLGLAGAEAGDKTFHIVPSEPIAIDWAAEPPRLWPPENGHTKFLLVNGLSRASPGGTEPSIEWGVGVEARLDPIPENMLRDLKSPVVTLATNWLGRVEDVSSPSENLDHFSDTRTQTQDEAAEH